MKMIVIQLYIVLCLISCHPFHPLTHVNTTKNGNKEGVWLESDTLCNSINTVSVSMYRRGIKNGKHICFYPNGLVEKKGHYKNGIKNGKWYFYFADGSGPNILKYLPTDTIVVKIINARW